MSKTPGRLVAVTAVTMLVAACSGSTDGGAGDALTLVTYGSAFQQAQEEAVVTPFETATGTKVTVESPTDLAKLKVMVQSGKPTWDVYLASQQDVPAYCGEYFDKVDMTNIKSDQFPPGTLDACGVPFDTYSYLLAYNTDKYGANPPTSIKDFFDTERFPGTRALSNDPGEGNFEFALLADDVAAKDLYPLDYDRAFKVLDRIKSGAIFWSSGAEQVAAMEQQRADMILVWSGRGYEATQNGAPYAPVWKDNSYHWASLSIVKGSPNREAAQKFIESATAPEAQARFSEAIAYGPANLAAKPNLDAARSEWDSSRQEHRDKSWQIDTKWWAEHQDEAIQRWTRWTSG